MITDEFRIAESSTDWIMRITADRRIEVNEGVDVTYAAQKVLDAMQLMLLYCPATEESSALQEPKREWVELTENEAFACRGRDYFETYKAIEAKLKEKNT